MRQVFLLALAGVAGWVVFAAPVPARAQAAYQSTDLTPAGTTFFASDYDFPGGFAAGTATVGGSNHAARRDLRTGQVTDLHPSAVYYASEARGAAGGVQVGYAHQNPPDGGSAFIHRAFLWRPGFGPLNLHPAAYFGSFAIDTDGVNHVGYAWDAGLFGPRDALLWRGASANNYVDLTPRHLGFTDAVALSIHGGRQLGDAWHNSRPNERRPVIWSGTAQSAAVLQPPEGFAAATARGIHGNVQAGEAFTVGQRGRHAVVWHDEPDSVVDLHPVGAGFEESDLWGMSGSRQVGSVYNIAGFPTSRRAAVWSGTAESFVNLHDFLPEGYTHSTATGVDEEGNVYGTAFTAGGVGHFFVWRPVPEPSAVFALGAAGAVGLLRRRR